MVCEKCQQTLNESYTFCPYCGSKVKNKIKPCFSNGEFLTFCREQDFVNEFEKVKKMSGEDAYLWFKAMHEGMTIYALRMDYAIEYEYKLEKKVIRKSEVCSLEVAMKIAKEKRRYINVSPTQAVSGKYIEKSFVVEEKILNKYTVKKIGEIWHWDRSTVEKEIEEINAACAATQTAKEKCADESAERTR